MVASPEILGISDGQMRRWHERYEKFGFRGLFDRRGNRSPKKVPLAVVEKVLGLYREKHFDVNVRHFHEKLQAEHQVEISYSWVKGLLQRAGMVAKGRNRGVHRKVRLRRPLPGMLLHIDGSERRWFQDERWHDLLVILDDANSEIYYAHLVEQPSGGSGSQPFVPEGHSGTHPRFVRYRNVCRGATGIALGGIMAQSFGVADGVLFCGDSGSAVGTDCDAAS